jgi:DNA polymerase III delta prime subunit
MVTGLVRTASTMRMLVIERYHRPNSRKSGFKHGGKYALNQYRALLLYGPPGVGKTTSAHLCAKLEGYTPIELNASDARSKKLIEVCGIYSRGSSPDLP